VVSDWRRLKWLWMRESGSLVRRGLGRGRFFCLKKRRLRDTKLRIVAL
jgi:hypothetical protein